MSERAYKELVLDAFDRMLDGQLLPPELVSRTRRSLKAHCVRVCTERFEKKDEMLLESVFGTKENKTAYVNAIKNVNADIFRALHTFLNDRTVNTTFTNICLLAWMIDFEPRPYYPGLKLPERVVLSPNERYDRHRKEDGSPGGKDKTSKNKLLLTLLVAGVLLFSGYLFTRFKKEKIIGDERCMIWSGDHYEPVNCSRKFVVTPLLPIDRHLIDNFRRITRPDTLTLHSVKKVWYINTRGRIEFYNGSGSYPLDTSRRLLPMTDYILKKYVYHLID